MIQFRPPTDGDPLCVGVTVNGSEEVACIVPIVGDLTESRMNDISRRMTSLIAACLCVEVTSSYEVPGVRGSSIFDSNPNPKPPETSARGSSVLEPEDGPCGSVVVEDDGVGYRVDDEDFYGLLPIVGTMSDQRRAEIATFATSLISACIAPDFVLRVGPSESM